MASGIIHAHTHSELLWTNPSPNSAIANGASISVDFKSWKVILVAYLYNTGGTTLRSAVMSVSENMPYTLEAYPGGAGYQSRDMTITSTGVTFGTVSNTSRMIPMYIYGIA